MSAFSEETVATGVGSDVAAGESAGVVVALEDRQAVATELMTIEASKTKGVVFIGVPSVSAPRERQALRTTYMGPCGFRDRGRES
jgi:hypothetical protein